MDTRQKGEKEESSRGVNFFFSECHMRMVPGRHHCRRRIEGEGVEGCHLVGGVGQTDVRAAAAAFAGANVRDRLLLVTDLAIAQTNGGGGGGTRCHLSFVVVLELQQASKINTLKVSVGYFAPLFLLIVTR